MSKFNHFADHEILQTERQKSKLLWSDLLKSIEYSDFNSRLYVQGRDNGELLRAARQENDVISVYEVTSFENADAQMKLMDIRNIQDLAKNDRQIYVRANHYMRPHYTVSEIKFTHVNGSPAIVFVSDLVA